MLSLGVPTFKKKRKKKEYLLFIIIQKVKTSETLQTLSPILSEWHKGVPDQPQGPNPCLPDPPVA